MASRDVYENGRLIVAVTETEYWACANCDTLLRSIPERFLPSDVPTRCPTCGVSLTEKPMDDEQEPNPKLDLLVKMARQMKVCRICAKPDGGPLTLNFGKEYAHTACLSALAERDPLGRLVTEAARVMLGYGCGCFASLGHLCTGCSKLSAKVAGDIMEFTKGAEYPAA